MHDLDLMSKLVNYPAKIPQMFRIGVLSDTHGYFDPRIITYFGNCDEIWHAGDIGDYEVLVKLKQIAPVVAVYGNVDGNDIRSGLPLNQRKIREDLDIWMTHIGGYPGHYESRVKPAIFQEPPGLFISGHSHILKVMPDRELGLLHMNPGAAGRFGMHQVRTLIRFCVDDAAICDVDVIELGGR